MVNSSFAHNCTLRDVKETRVAGMTFYRFPEKEPKRTLWLKVGPQLCGRHLGVQWRYAVSIARIERCVSFRVKFPATRDTVNLFPSSYAPFLIHACAVVYLRMVSCKISCIESENPDRWSGMTFFLGNASLHHPLCNNAHAQHHVRQY